MDIITHALLGAAVAPSKHLAIPMAITSTLPDLWTIPPLAEYLLTHRGRFRNQEFWKWIPRRYDQLTRWSHSVVPLAVSYGVGDGLLHLSSWLFLPWLLHLLIDIPTHARSRTGFLLYPFSRWQPLGKKNWYDLWWISVLSIAVLGLIVAFRFAT